MPFSHSKKATNKRANRNQFKHLDTKASNTSSRKPRKFSGLWIIVVIGMLGGGAYWLRFGTIQGVPASIVGRFVIDKTARDAYFERDLNTLHDRLSELGVEEEIKAFYRPQFDDEVRLDWYIHQLLYDRTGYIGQSYKLGANQRLILKTSADKRFPHWLKLAQKVGLVFDHYQQEGIIYLILSDGSTVLYEPFSQTYPLKSLRQIHRVQKKQKKQQIPGSRF